MKDFSEDSWDDPRPQSSGEEWRPAKNKEDSEKTPSTALERMKEERLITLRTLLKKMRDRGQGITPMRPPTMSDEKNFENQIQREPEPMQENTIDPTNSISERSSEPVKYGETLPMDSSLPSTVLKEESLASLSLLRNTANDLHSLMRGLNKKPEDRNDMQLLDPDRVRAAATVAQQIISCMRTSLDVVKFAKELHDSKDA